MNNDKTGIMSGYEYAGRHFIPHAKLGKVNELSELMLRSDRELGCFDFNYPEHGFIQKYKYSHKDFYKAMNDSEMDIFICLENRKMYIPCEHELFIYEGRRKRR